MPNLLYFLHMVRSWRIDTEDVTPSKAPSTPVINIMPSVEDPEKKPVVDNAVISLPETTPTRSRLSWFTSLLSKLPNKSSLTSAPGETGELQNMLPSSVVVQKSKNGKEEKPAHEICLMTESPFRILRIVNKEEVLGYFENSVSSSFE